jgi:hypothetical protein
MPQLHDKRCGCYGCWIKREDAREEFSGFIGPAIGIMLIGTAVLILLILSSCARCLNCDAPKQAMSNTAPSEPIPPAECNRMVNCSEVCHAEDDCDDA